MLSIKLHSEQLIKRSFKKFIQKTGRLSFELKELSELLKIRSNFEYLRQKLSKPQTVTNMFKILILLNRVIIDNCIKEDQVQGLINELHWSFTSEFQEMLTNKLIRPYQLYLQKRVASNLECSADARGIGSEMKVYQLLNLINLGTSFTDIIYTFGRYYLQKFASSIDFNITIGADLQLIYNKMVATVSRPASKFILQQIETIHEKLYVVFYNCYFHKYLKQYVPKWVVTDVRCSTPRKNISNKSTRSNSNTFSRSCTPQTKYNYSKNIKSKTSHYDLSQSCLILNDKVEEEEVENVEIDDDNRYDVKQEQQKERLHLILSMERVVEMIQTHNQG